MKLALSRSRRKDELNACDKSDAARATVPRRDVVVHHMQRNKKTIRVEIESASCNVVGRESCSLLMNRRTHHTLVCISSSTWANSQPTWLSGYTLHSTMPAGMCQLLAKADAK